MEHKVFISHSSADKQIADAICHYLEDASIRCWIAPRDINSIDWAGSIMRGLTSCDVFVVVISHNSIPSGEVAKEVTEATRVCQYILPFKVDEEMLNDRLRYHLAPCHWLDAVNPPLEKHIEQLIARIQNLSNEDAGDQNTSRQRLIGKTVNPIPFFMGREEELRQVHEMLDSDRILFLQGMGGIGKSEIAKGYAKAYSHCYDTVLLANYAGSVQDMIIGEDIQVENLKRSTAYGEDAESDAAFFKRKLQAIKDCANSRTLLIVDNFDTAYDDLLDDLLSGPYRVLLTTRYEHYDYPCLPVGPISDPETGRQLFARNYGRPLNAAQKEIVDQILELVGRHTITVELIAKQMRASFMQPQKMLQLLQEGGLNSGLKEGIHRGAQSKRAFDFITDLFRLSSLTEEEARIMRCMCMVPFSGIDVNRLGQYLQLESFDTVNDLIAQSWLMLDEETCFLKMHPIICDVAKDQLKPDTENCRDYILGLWRDLDNAWYQSVEERSEKWPYLEYFLRHYGHPTTELWQQYSDFANFAWICSRFPQAIETSKRVYEFTVTHFGDAGYKPAFAARAVAGAYFNAGDEAGAEPYYRLGLEHMRKKPEDSYKELGLICQKVGRCAANRGEYEEAKACFAESLAALDKAIAIPAEEALPMHKTDTYVSLARMCMAMGDYPRALEYSQTAYDLMYAWRGCEVTSCAYSLSDMGICYSCMGEFEKAEDYLQRALALNIRFNGEASMVTVRTKESIADNLARQGKIGEAKRGYLALELDMEKNFGSECPYVQHLRQKGEAL